MKLKSYILVLLSIFSVGCADSFTQNYFEEQTINESFFTELVSDFSASIERYTEDKIYIKPDSIKSTHLGMVLDQGNKVLHLPVVFSDRCGAFVPMNENERPVSITYCLGCGWVKFEGDPCRNPKCRLKK
ncbi:MAG: hypothetical protein KFB95_01315 [Simkaniaceae bacterium]|nr:MAG: hypothetical protein KFB95_01315 [Simkaniaceae bacterium]